MRKIAAVTGTRAEYGILRPVLKAIDAHPELELALVVTGMHLLHEFGDTVKEIERDGFKIDARVDMLLASDTLSGMAKSVGLGIFGMAQTWEQLRPHIVLVLGDRLESFAATVASAYMHIPVAHLQGGDTGIGSNIDNPNRHAMTKFAHIHLPATEEARERIIKMGEEEWRVYNVGSPALDSVLNEELLPSEEIVRKYSVDLSQPLILLIQHSVTTQVDEASHQMRITLEAIKELSLQTILIYPNSDAGGRKMIEIIKQYEDNPHIKIYKNIIHKEYLSLMQMASAIVGNSSSAYIEAPSFGLPAIQIGIRQKGREKGNNVIEIGHDKQEIVKAIEKALTDKEFLAEVKKCENPYGDGKTGPRVAEILNKIEVTPELIRKKITY